MNTTTTYKRPSVAVFGLGRLANILRRSPMRYWEEVSALLADWAVANEAAAATYPDQAFKGKAYTAGQIRARARTITLDIDDANLDVYQLRRNVTDRDGVRRLSDKRMVDLDYLEQGFESLIKAS